jgi:predicted membrane protein
MIFLLRNMGIFEVDWILRFWPVILIAFGAFRIIEYGDNYGQSSGIFWVVTGGLFLLGSFGILPVSFRDFWPVVLIGLGSLLLWRTVLRGRRPVHGSAFGGPGSVDAASSRGETAGADNNPQAQASAQSSERPTNSFITATAILSGVERRYYSQDFRGGNVTAILGGCEIDLRESVIVGPPDPVLEVFALWGAIKIRVPSDWTIVSEVDPIMGGFEDGTRPPRGESKRLRIHGTVIMGAVELKD